MRLTIKQILATFPPVCTITVQGRHTRLSRWVSEGGVVGYAVEKGAENRVVGAPAGFPVGTVTLSHRSGFVAEDLGGLLRAGLISDPDGVLAEIAAAKAASAAKRGGGTSAAKDGAAARLRSLATHVAATEEEAEAEAKAQAEWVAAGAKAQAEWVAAQSEGAEAVAE